MKSVGVDKEIILEEEIKRTDARTNKRFLKPQKLFSTTNSFYVALIPVTVYG